MLASLSRTLLPSLGSTLETAAYPLLSYASKAVASTPTGGKEVAASAKTNWQALAQALPKQTKDSIPTTTGGAAFANDLRGTSALGLGDGITDHTSKWLQGNQKSPIQYINDVEPIKVDGNVVASYGSDDPALGCPVEYICLKGTSKESPAVCKYTGNRYYSDTWRHGAHH